MLLGLLSLLIGEVIGSSFLSIGTKIGLQFSSPLLFVFLRFVISSAIFFPLFFFSKKKKLVISDYRKFLLLASFLFINVTLFTIGIQYTTAIMSQILYTSAPIFVGIFGHYFLEEKLTRYKVIGLLIAFTGVSVLLYKSIHSQENLTFGTPVGNVLILVAVLGYSAWVLYSRSLNQTKRYTSIQLSFFTFLIIAFYLMLLVPFESILIPNSSNHISQLGLIFAGIVGLGNVSFYFLFQVGIKRTNAFTVSLFQYLGPFFTGLISIPLLHEKINLTLIFGGALIIFGVFYATGFTYFKKKFLRDSIKI